VHPAPVADRCDNHEVELGPIGRAARARAADRAISVVVDRRRGRATYVAPACLRLFVGVPRTALLAEPVAGGQRRVERAPKGAVAAAILDEVESLRKALDAPTTFSEKT